MKVLIDILHPAHVHFFRNLIVEMKRRGHTIFVTARKKDVALQLLVEYEIPHTVISRIGKGKVSLARELIVRNMRMIRICKKIEPDLLIGVMGPSIATVGKLMGIPSVVFYNNENANATNWFVYPLAKAVCTSSSYAKKIRGNHVTYPGYHEFAYLHPNYFSPSKETVRKLHINLREKYVLVRFVSWQASHDVGEKGISHKVELIRELEKFAKVYITSETGVPAELKSNILRIENKKDVFHVMNYAELVFGEGATMASEAAMLGVPAVYVNSLQLGYLKEQERDFGLVYNFTKQEPALAKAQELLQKENLKEEFQARRRKMIEEKVDVTIWMAGFIENFMRTYSGR